MLAVCPSSAPYSPLHGEHGLILLILPRYMEALGLWVLCAALTAGPFVIRANHGSRCPVVWQVWQTTGTDGNLLLVCLVFLLFLLRARVDEKNQPTLLLYSKE